MKSLTELPKTMWDKGMFVVQTVTVSYGSRSMDYHIRRDPFKGNIVEVLPLGDINIYDDELAVISEAFTLETITELDDTLFEMEEGDTLKHIIAVQCYELSSDLYSTEKYIVEYKLIRNFAA